MQRIILITLLLLGGILSSIAQEKHTVTIEFEGMKSDKGNLFVAIYNAEDSFLKKPLKGTIVKIAGKKATITLDIPAGVYAISAFHDENDNKKMDTNFFGIPKEPTGISNDAKGFIGSPKYKDAKFTVSKDIKLTISVR